MRNHLKTLSKTRRPLSAQIEKNIFYAGPSGVTKQQGRAELLEMRKHKAFSSKGKMILLLHAISSYGVWSEGLGGCDHAWKSSFYQVKNIYAVKLRTSNVFRIFFFLPFQYPSRPKPLTMDGKVHVFGRYLISQDVAVLLRLWNRSPGHQHACRAHGLGRHVLRSPGRHCAIKQNKQHLPPLAVWQTDQIRCYTISCNRGKGDRKYHTCVCVLRADEVRWDEC